MGSRDTDIFITPGFDFKVVDVLIPLNSTRPKHPDDAGQRLAGYDIISALYQHAIEQRYRFFQLRRCHADQNAPPSPIERGPHDVEI